MTTAGQIRDTVRAVLCKGLTPEQTEQIMRVLVPVHAGAGHPLVREGDHPTGLFVLLKGRVEILKKAADGGAPQQLTTIDAPTVLGEMSLITDRPHSATVRAVTDCELFLMTKAQFQRLLSSESLAAYKLIAVIAEVLAGRLARLDQKVLELSAARATAAPVEELAAFKHKLFSEWSF